MTYSEARAHLKQAIDDVCRDHEPTILTRQRGEPAVLLSLEDYNGMLETIHLLGTPNNAKRLKDSIAQLEAGEYQQKTSIDDDEEKERSEQAPE